MLWEIGLDSCDVRNLRSRLDLDSGLPEPAAAPLEAGPDHVGAERGRGRIRRAGLTARAQGAGPARRRSDERPGRMSRRWRPASATASSTHARGAAAAHGVDGRGRADDPSSPRAVLPPVSTSPSWTAASTSGFDREREHPGRGRRPAPARTDVFLVATLARRTGRLRRREAPRRRPVELKRMWVSDGAARPRRRLLERAGGRAGGPARGDPPRDERALAEAASRCTARAATARSRLQRRALRRPLVREGPRVHDRRTRGRAPSSR